MTRGLATRVRRIAPLAALIAAGGCFATRQDVRVIQGDIASMRTELLRSDAELRQSVLQLTQLLAAANDSLNRLSARLVAVQGDVRGETRSIREQLLQVQQLVGQSQAALRGFKAELEARNNAPPPTAIQPVMPPSTPPNAAGTRDSVRADSAMTVTPPPTVLGPNQLYEEGSNQLKRGSTATARRWFTELITNYPTSDLASDAWFGIGDSYSRERNFAGADSAYATVVQKFPNSRKAPTALYKRAQLQIQQQQVARARVLLNEVISKYPRSDEADLAADQLKTLK